MIPISDIITRSISGYIFMIPILVLFFIYLHKTGRKQSILHMGATFIFCYYLFGVLTVTGIGYTNSIRFRPNISWTPFIGMITGPVDTALNIFLFIPFGLFLPLLFKKFNNIKASDMRDFFQTDFGKDYYNKWLKEHGKVKPKHTQYDYEDDEDE